MGGAHLPVTCRGPLEQATRGGAGVTVWVDLAFERHRLDLPRWSSQTRARTPPPPSRPATRFRERHGTRRAGTPPGKTGAPVARGLGRETPEHRVTDHSPGAARGRGVGADSGYRGGGCAGCALQARRRMTVEGLTTGFEATERHVTEPHVIDPSSSWSTCGGIDRTTVSTGVGARAGSG